MLTSFVSQLAVRHNLNAYELYIYIDLLPIMMFPHVLSKPSPYDIEYYLNWCCIACSPWDTSDCFSEEEHNSKMLKLHQHQL